MSASLLTVGGKFGDFEVVRELGIGGMGAVYLVRDPETGEQYAAKVMFPDDTPDRADAARRFLREAESAMRVNHPNLVHVYDVGRDPETQLGYMIMDYLTGGDLRDKIVGYLQQGQKFPIREALLIVRTMAEVLEAVDDCDLVHRDIKPDNILFDGDGVPYLADLGVARVADKDVSTMLTMNSVVIGTPAYMAPEQFEDSHHVDIRADIYSLGVVLWEMLAGEGPNAGHSSAAIMSAAIKRRRIPDIRNKRAKTPPYVVELLRRMTDPVVARRMATPRQIYEFLDRRDRFERRRMMRFVGITVTVVLAMIVAALVWWARMLESKFQSQPTPAPTCETPADDVFAIPDSIK